MWGSFGILTDKDWKSWGRLVSKVSSWFSFFPHPPRTGPIQQSTILASSVALEPQGLQACLRTKLLSECCEVQVEVSLKVRNHGSPALTYCPTCQLPGAFHPLLHFYFISNIDRLSEPLLIQKNWLIVQPVNCQVWLKSFHWLVHIHFFINVDFLLELLLTYCLALQSPSIFVGSYFSIS